MRETSYGAKWIRRFFDEAAGWASMSKDPSTRVGAVLVDARKRIIGTGYNGLPEQLVDKPHLLVDREWKYPRVIHAELNAILNATRTPRGATLFCTMMPCGSECAKLVLGAGLVKIHTLQTIGEERRERYKPQFELGHRIMIEAHLNVNVWDAEEVWPEGIPAHLL